MSRTQGKQLQTMKSDENAVRNSDGTFKKGVSGNPSGRPKRTDIERAILAQIYTLAPQAVDSLKKLLTSNETPPNVRLRAVEIVVNRICGTALNADALEDYENKLRFDGLSVSESELTKAIFDCLK